MVSGGVYLSGEEGHGGAVDPGVVPGGRHALQVVLALGRVDAGARQLPVVHYDVVPLHRFLHGNQGVFTHHGEEAFSNFLEVDLCRECMYSIITHHNPNPRGGISSGGRAVGW